MHTVDYSQTRLMRGFMLFMGGGLVSAVMMPGGVLKWLVTAVLFAAGALSGIKLFGDRSALVWDQRGVTLITLTGRKSVDWREVLDIGAERMTQYLWGFIPIASVDFLAVKTRGGLIAAKKLRISASLLELPAGGSAGLALTLKRAHAAAIGGGAIPDAAAPAPRQPVAEADATGDSGFDPDAVIARYMAQKSATAPAVDPAAAPPAMPVRPVFGRKAV